MAKSIIQTTKECYLCREEAERRGYYGALRSSGLHKHHLLGGPNRTFAEHYGLWAYVCAERHHEYGPEAPHVNADVATHLKQIAQKEFEKKYGHDEWMRVFGKNYLD